jgi:hypothetical protein
MITRHVVVFCAFLMAEMVSAAEPNWRFVSARSHGSGVSCNNQSVQLVEAGSDVSLLFDNLRADLVGGDGKKINAQFGTCITELAVTIPKGHYIVSSSTTLVGGVEKSARAFGYIQFWTYIWGKARDSVEHHSGPGLFSLLNLGSRIFNRSQIISEPLVQIPHSKSLPKHEQRILCNATKTSSFDAKIVMYINVGGFRDKNSETAIVAVDSLDSSVLLGVKTERCPG